MILMDYWLIAAGVVTCVVFILAAILVYKPRSRW